ncbi:MAG: ThiF family adenylyltransferase [Betaproteobacteria bacterium]|nr:ThiF family adenylyltransferase [Betaproteobacteria bacterium]
MTTSRTPDSYFQAIEAACSAQGLQVTRTDAITADCLGLALQGTHRQWSLELALRTSPLNLPALRVIDPGGLLAHVGYDGTICVTDRQGLSLDVARPEDVAAHTVLAGFRLLEEAAEDATSGHQEFLKEFEGYWSGIMPNMRFGRAALEADGRGRFILGYASHKNAEASNWLFLEDGAAPPRGFRLEGLKRNRALYVHLDVCPLPPLYRHTLNVEFVQAVVERMSAAQRELWEKLLGPSKNSPKRLALLISTPRPGGGNSFIGLTFGAARGELSGHEPVVPLTVRRHTVPYMRERGGASNALGGKHVAVLGCGAIGAVVADTLAAVGVGKLTLVDYDAYNEDNVFRHVLDPIFIDCPKPTALKFHLEGRYPGLEVIDVHKTAEDWLEAMDVASLGLHGVVVAIGLPTVDRHVARCLRHTGAHLPVVFTWLEALDLGGHSVLTWADQERCLDCLYRDDEGHQSQHSRTAFLEADQAVSRNLTGCTSIFVPYGALQARRTALMAAEHLLEAMLDGNSTSYRAWVGKGAAAQEEGLRTTNWWATVGELSECEATERLFGLPCKTCRDCA